MAEPTRIEVAVPVPTGPAVRRDNQGTTGQQFVPMNGLTAGLTASRRDLAAVRTIAAKLNEKVTALSNRSQYTPGFIAEETAKLRQAASNEAQNYLVQQKTFPRLTTMATQAPHWTTPQYLGRQQAAEDLQLEQYNDSGNQIKLLKGHLAATRLTNLLLSASMLDTDSLAAVGDAAVEAGDWTRLSVIVNALSGRAENGNEKSQRAKVRLEHVTIPDCQAALELLEEAKKIEEWIESSLRSISTGGDDVGVRTARYIEMQNARTAEQQQSQEEREMRADLRRRAG